MSLFLNFRHKFAYASNYSSILDLVVENNYQLFYGRETLNLTDDPKKNTWTWQIPVYTLDTGDFRSFLLRIDLEKILPLEITCWMAKYQAESYIEYN